jgi:hypothetical protein
MICHAVKYRKKGEQYERVDVMVLDDDRPQIFLLEAFCGDFEKPTPKSQHAFAIQGIDVRATTVIVQGKKAQVSIRTIQAAVWLQNDAPEAEIRRRFKATDVELQAAGLLVHRGDAVLPQRVSVDFQTEEGGAPVRGLIAIADLQLVSETELEVETIDERCY